MGRTSGAGEPAAQAFFEKFIFILIGDISVHDLRTWRGKASVRYGGEGGYVSRGVSAENEIRVGGHPNVRLTGREFDKYSGGSCRRSVADGLG